RDLPLLERVHFLAIFSNNLDDFFQIRVAGLQEQVLAAVPTTAPDGMSPADQLRAIRRRVEGLIDRQMRLFNKELLPGLDASGIRIRGGDSLTRDEGKQLGEEFPRRELPVLDPLPVDAALAFPYV